MVEDPITDNLAAMPYPVLGRVGRMMDAYTEDRLTNMARALLQDKQELLLQFNMDSCMAFLIDEDMQVYVAQDDKLAAFVWCPDCGNEGPEKEFYPSDGCAMCKSLARDISLSIAHPDRFFSLYESRGGD